MLLLMSRSYRCLAAADVSQLMSFPSQVVRGHPQAASRPGGLAVLGPSAEKGWPSSRGAQLPLGRSSPSWEPPNPVVILGHTSFILMQCDCDRYT